MRKNLRYSEYMTMPGIFRIMGLGGGKSIKTEVLKEVIEPQYWYILRWAAKSMRTPYFFPLFGHNYRIVKEYIDVIDIEAKAKRFALKSIFKDPGSYAPISGEDLLKLLDSYNAIKYFPSVPKYTSPKGRDDNQYLYSQITYLHNGHYYIAFISSKWHKDIQIDMLKKVFTNYFGKDINLNDILLNSMVGWFKPPKGQRTVLNEYMGVVYKRISLKRVWKNKHIIKNFVPLRSRSWLKDIRIKNPGVWYTKGMLNKYIWLTILKKAGCPIEFSQKDSLYWSMEETFLYERYSYV